MEEIIRIDLEEVVQDILDLGNAESVFSVEEVLSIVFKFYGAVTNAVQFCVITPEQGYTLHLWLVAMFELN